MKKTVLGHRDTGETCQSYTGREPDGIDSPEAWGKCMSIPDKVFQGVENEA